MNMKQWKRSGLTLFLCTALLSGCFAKEEKPQAEVSFDDYIASLPTQMISNDNMNLEFLFEDPTKYGFTPELLNLPYATLEDYKEGEKETQDMIDTIKAYDYDALNAEQKMTYDILIDSLERSQGMDEFYYLDNNYLGSFIGFQAQLPLLLTEYTFETENDLNSYFHILETSEEMFLKYAENEKERQKNGVGMSKGILDKVIEQCENFTKDTEPFLIAGINEKIDAISFLDDTQKEAAKTKNENLLRNNFINAYKHLGEELSTIDAPTEELGLAHLKNGKAYYEYLLKSSTGIDDSVPEIKLYLEDKKKAIMKEMQTMIFTDKALAAKYMEMANGGSMELTYSNFTTFEDTIDYLGEKMKQDYPDVGKLNYDITIVPESMKDNFSPAAYLQGKIDAPADAPEHIWVNGEYNQNLFETLAHEGYPGHMYQHTYFKQQNLPTVRYLIDYNGYSEGWATYIEGNAWKYADVNDEDKKMLHLMRLNQNYTQCIIGLLDIAIHYEGISYEEYQAVLKDEFGIEDEETAKEQWYLILETPTNYLQYYLTGMKYQDLYDKAEDALQEKFDTVKFNEALLKNGPAPYALLEKEVDAYIKNAK